MRRHVDPEGTVQLHDLLVNLHVNERANEPSSFEPNEISHSRKALVCRVYVRTFESGGISSDSNTGRLAELLRADTAEAGGQTGSR